MKETPSKILFDLIVLVIQGVIILGIVQFLFPWIKIF